MNKITTALWKGLKHGLTAGGGAALAALTAGADYKLVAMTFVYGFLAGIGVNVQAIKKA